MFFLLFKKSTCRLIENKRDLIREKPVLQMRFGAEQSWSAVSASLRAAAPHHPADVLIAQQHPTALPRPGGPLSVFPSQHLGRPWLCQSQSAQILATPSLIRSNGLSRELQCSAAFVLSHCVVTHVMLLCTPFQLLCIVKEPNIYPNVHDVLLFSSWGFALFFFTDGLI